MGLGLVIGDASLQVLISCSVEDLDEAVRVELVVADFQALLGLWAVLNWLVIGHFWHWWLTNFFWIWEWSDKDLPSF